jgi:acyl carrier protein
MTVGSELADVIDVFSTVFDGHRQIVEDSDFFDLGGNSLQAALLSAHLRRRFDRELSVRDVFRLRTPGAIASFLNGSA